MGDWIGQYILIGRVPFPEKDTIKWAKWFAKADRRVAEDWIGKTRVSTVFLALDRNYFDEGDAILFETMVFPSDQWDIMERYATWKEAEAGHKKIVNRIKRSLKNG